jgi:hypothetical protein
MPNLSEILDVDIPLPTTNTSLVVSLPVPDVSSSANNTVAQDAQDARTNVRLMIAQGTQAVTELLQLARDLKTPRAYEVASNMLKTMAELSQDLLTVHQQEQSLQEAPPEGGDVNIQNAVFIGSTADLGELVKKRRNMKYANTITVQAESVSVLPTEASKPEILPQESQT